MIIDVSAIQEELSRFAMDRDWEKYHTPNNLAMALASEVGELTDIFQWLTEEESCQLVHEERGQRNVADELADVLIYTLRLADKLSIDIERSVKDKIALNAEKYPVGLAHGNSTKDSKRRSS